MLKRKTVHGEKMNNKMLLYVTQRSVEVFQNEIGEMPEFHLYKILFLIQQELLKSEINIHLPYYWYFKGPLLSVPGFYKQTGVSFDLFFPPSNWSKKTKFVTNPNIEIEEPDQKDKINNAIDIVIGSICGMSTSSSSTYLATEVYKYAPNSFQRNFKKFEKMVDHDGDYENALLLFDKLVSEFPDDKYQEMMDLFLEWETIIDLSFEMKKYSYIEDINKPFWRAFSY